MSQAGIIGNWLTGIALTKNVVNTTRLFLLALIAVHIIVYFVGEMLIPMVIIVTLWGIIHTGGFLINQIRTTSAAPEAQEVASSLNISFSNAGVALGTFLGGAVTASFGIQQLVWTSVLFLFLALLLSFANSCDPG